MWVWVHQAIAFAIASKFCRQLLFARNFRSEHVIFAISSTKPFAPLNSQLFVWDLVAIWGASAFAFADVSAATAVHSGPQNASDFTPRISTHAGLIWIVCFRPSTIWGPKNQRKLFWYKVSQQPFGSWTSAPKIVDVRTKKCVFLRPRWWGETFWPLGIRA